MRRMHSRIIHHCTAACTEGRTRTHPAHNTHQHTCTPASLPVEMDGEAANKRRRFEPKPHPASLDFISSLPDDMLLVIIGLLPTKSAVRTALLSRRWRPLLRHVPLNLTVDSCLCDGDCKRMAAVSKILSSQLVILPCPIPLFLKSCESNRS